MGFFDFLKNKSKPAEEKVDRISVLAANNDFKSQLDNIQDEIFLFLKPLGFKKKGRTFNRQTEDGICQVVNIQSGKYEFGDKYVVPRLRENYYGKFTINLGVMVKEIYELDHHHKPKDIYQDYDCQIRTRLTHLTIKQELWWPISDDILKIAEEIIEGLNSQGIPWLDTFENRQSICKNWRTTEGSSRRAKLDVELIVLQSDKEKGAQLIQDYYNNIENHSGHKEYVKVLAERLGLKVNDRP
ncbi:DUF4304 domain-containing protein [Mucilaginibacter sp. RCC_168]|uniref:DUF4304 domain-containing protein n=1 Tax=Mucilaginibacter sp. RCC_168 TaxID=3239221 RepID=UPI0035251624